MSEPSQNYNKGPLETLWTSAKNLYSHYATPFVGSATGQYRDATALLLIGAGLMVYALITAIRYQGLLHEQSIDGAIAFGMLTGLNGAGIVLIVTAAVITIVRSVWGRFR